MDHKTDKYSHRPGKLVGQLAFEQLSGPASGTLVFDSTETVEAKRDAARTDLTARALWRIRKGGRIVWPPFSIM